MDILDQVNRILSEVWRVAGWDRSNRDHRGHTPSFAEASQQIPYRRSLSIEAPGNRLRLGPQLADLRRGSRHPQGNASDDQRGDGVPRRSAGGEGRPDFAEPEDLSRGNDCRSKRQSLQMSPKSPTEGQRSPIPCARSTRCETLDIMKATTQNTTATNT